MLEAASSARIGRFGWKGQHASLESFSADAYLNEMGITTPLFPEENTSNGRFVGFGSGYDPVADPEDDGVDVGLVLGLELGLGLGLVAGEATVSVCLRGQALFQHTASVWSPTVVSAGTAAVTLKPPLWSAVKVASS